MDSEQSRRTSNISRRTTLRLLTSGSVAALLSACGTPAAPSQPTPAPPTSPPAGTQSAAAPTTTSAAAGSSTPAAKTSAEPPGTLTVAYADLGSQLFDPTTALYGVPLYLVYEPLLRY